MTEENEVGEDLVEDDSSPEEEDSDVEEVVDKRDVKRSGRHSNPDVQWIGAKFDLLDPVEKVIADKAIAVAKNSRLGMKKLIAEMVLSAHDNVDDNFGKRTPSDFGRGGGFKGAPITKEEIIEAIKDAKEQGLI